MRVGPLGISFVSFALRVSAPQHFSVTLFLIKVSSFAREDTSIN